MNLEELKEAQKKAIAKAVAEGMSEELATELFGSMLSAAEVAAAKVQSKLDDFDKVVKQRDDNKEKARLGEEALARLKKMEDEGKSELEIAQARVAELEDAQRKADAYEPLVQERYDTLVKDLPEKVKATIEDEGGSLDVRLKRAEAFADAIAVPGKGPGSELPTGFTGRTMTREEYNQLGNDGNLAEWEKAQEAKASGELRITD